MLRYDEEHLCGHYPKYKSFEHNDTQLVKGETENNLIMYQFVIIK